MGFETMCCKEEQAGRQADRWRKFTADCANKVNNTPRNHKNIAVYSRYRPTY
jgi:hypothetical protein